MKKIIKGLAVTCTLMAVGFVSFLGTTTEAAAVQSDSTYSARYYIKGDLNMDGKITLADAEIANNAANGYIILTDLETKIGDMNNNGVVDKEDAQIILRMALGID